MHVGQDSGDSREFQGAPLQKTIVSGRIKNNRPYGEQQKRGLQFFPIILSERTPNQMPPPHEKVVGSCAGAYSRRINIQRHQVYQILDRPRMGQ